MMLPRTGSHSLLFTDPVRYFSETYSRGYAEGFAAGFTAGMAKAILTVAEAGGLRVSLEQRDRILETSDTAALEGWLRRAATVTSAEQILG